MSAPADAQRNWAYRAQSAAEARLSLCESLSDWDDASDEADSDEADLPDDKAGDELAGPYCGCVTCIVREVLDAAVPIVLAAVWAGEVTRD